MKFSINTPELLVEDKTNNTVRELTIKKENINGHLGITRLSDVFNCIPNGIVYKEETGMGATTLELVTPRNSIIVEPIKITASSKAFKHSKSATEKVLYVGSTTTFHPQKITKAEIVNYINNDKIKFKKIIVVADSLYRVIEAIGDKVFDDYFLMLDEVDSFQMDSLYRKSMEECIETYKKFNVENRCMLSATVLNFSDPELQNEQKTEINYDIKQKREINIIKSATNNLIENTIEKIIEILQSSSEHKILVAYNSVKGVATIAEYLSKQGLLQVDEMSILCSKNSKDKVKIYYKELESDILPTKLNFVTSAYFTGFDLNEPFHLISVSGSKSDVHLLSDKRLKQIAGRCRHTLISETIIHDTANIDAAYQPPTTESILTDADIEVKALTCMHNHFKKSSVLHRIHSKISEQIMSALESSRVRFVRENKATGLPEISYLNVDAYIENANTKYQLYRGYDLLTNVLKSQNHKVKAVFKNSNIIAPKVDVDTLDKEQKVNQIVDILSNLKTVDDVQDYLHQNKLNGIQKKIAENYCELMEYVDNKQLLQSIKGKAVKRDSRALNNCLLAVSYATKPDGDLYKSRIKKYFPQGTKMPEDEIKRRLDLIFIEVQMNHKIKTNRAAIGFLKLHLKVSRKNRVDGLFNIKGENPLNLKVLKKRQEVEDILFPTFLSN